RIVHESQQRHRAAGTAQHHADRAARFSRRVRSRSSVGRSRYVVGEEQELRTSDRLRGRDGWVVPVESLSPLRQGLIDLYNGPDRAGRTPLILPRSSCHARRARRPNIRPPVRVRTGLNLGWIRTISLVAALGRLLFGYDWVVIGGAKSLL